MDLRIDRNRPFEKCLNGGVKGIVEMTEKGFQDHQSVTPDGLSPAG